MTTRVEHRDAFARDLHGVLLALLTYTTTCAGCGALVRSDETCPHVALERQRRRAELHAR